MRTPRHRFAAHRASRLRAILTGALLVAGGLFIGLMLSEAAHRIAQRFICIEEGRGYFEPGRGGWTAEPNGALWVPGCLGRRLEGPTYLQINAHGLRDRDFSYDKRAGVQRVLLLGDFITEGVQVPSERTF